MMHCHLCMKYYSKTIFEFPDFHFESNFNTVNLVTKFYLVISLIQLCPSFGEGRHNVFETFRVFFRFSLFSHKLVSAKTFFLSNIDLIFGLKMFNQTTVCHTSYDIYTTLTFDLMVKIIDSVIFLCPKHIQMVYDIRFRYLANIYSTF